jgi:hypothetical protein
LNALEPVELVSLNSQWEAIVAILPSSNRRILFYKILLRKEKISSGRRENLPNPIQPSNGPLQASSNALPPNNGHTGVSITISTIHKINLCHPMQALHPHAPTM